MPSRSCAAWKRSTPRKGVLCEFEIEPDARFHGEPGDLQELLGNLLENAFKWARSRVLLTASAGETAPNRRPGLLLAVDDDGPGIPPEQDRTMSCSAACAATSACRATASAWRSCRTSCAAIAANCTSAVRRNWAARVSR